ncbi:hypothetical protein DMB65_17885 [Flavobacterium cheongpyeongense]|uniref:PASTA domain-containing protein n=1 Tax=Flavobacterium cheongpyeongense TaxID=2212651 RepID=A0A2V4BK58_9FLAO|nr:PASTA domain-containing protein [Flavobacterium cheongpyeongense]PXY39355.1 hypothetical protein DMB65_17885 [Flavobacterium cheongpyeongense]
MNEYNIIINAIVKKFNDQTINRLSLTVQYYDLKQKGWATLASKTITNGVFKLETTATKLLSATSDTPALPQLRLVSTASLKTKETQVYSLGGSTTINDKTKTINYDFNTIWIADPEITKQLPNNKLDNSIMATLAIDPAVLSQIATNVENQLETALQKNDENKKIIENYTSQIESLKATMLNLNQTNEKNEASLNKIATENTSLSLLVQKTQLENASLQRTIGINTAQINELNKKNTELQQANTKGVETIQQLTQEKIKLTQEIEEIKQKLEAGNPGFQPINKVYNNIIDQVQIASDQTRDSKYKLSNLSLTLKTFVEQDVTGGVKIKFVDGEKINNVNGATISDIKIDIAEQATVTGNTLKMPNVLGLTETACRQVLHSIGLQLDTIYQFDVRNIPTGQAFKQSIPQGSPVNYNQTITVVFAKQN